MDTPARIRYIGHATVSVTMDGVHVLTDPLLRNWALHLRRRAPSVPPDHYQSVDLVLISHQHLDHLHHPSLRLLNRRAHVIVPKGAAKLLAEEGFKEIIEMEIGDRQAFSGLGIEAVNAIHSGRRFLPRSEIQPVGYLIQGSHKIYFAGDTDFYPEMRDFSGSLDLALLPVWGWGPNLGSGHMDPYRAALAASTLKPRIAVPIHWGTYHPFGVGWFEPGFLLNPPRLFSEFVARLAPEVDVRHLAPGETLVL